MHSTTAPPHFQQKKPFIGEFPHLWSGTLALYPGLLAAVVDKDSV